MSPTPFAYTGVIFPITFVEKLFVLIVFILIFELSTISYEAVYCNNDVLVGGSNFLIGAIYNPLEIVAFNSLPVAFNTIIFEISGATALFPIAIEYFPKLYDPAFDPIAIE